MNDSEHHRLRHRLAHALERAALAQRCGLLSGIDEGFDELDQAIPRDDDPRGRRLLVALAFWEGWSDSCEHGWYFYEPLTEGDWPVLGVELAADLRADRDIANPTVLQLFDQRPREQPPSLWMRLKGALRVG